MEEIMYVVEVATCTGKEILPNGEIIMKYKDPKYITVYGLREHKLKTYGESLFRDSQDSRIYYDTNYKTVNIGDTFICKSAGIIPYRDFLKQHMIDGKNSNIPIDKKEGESEKKR